MKKLRVILWAVILTAGVPAGAVAQCAMCRTQLENNVSNGDVGIAAGINVGILYLLVMPYLCIMTLGYFWYKSSKKNAGTKSITAG